MKDVLNENIERLLNIFEKKRIEQLVEVLGSKKEIAKRNFVAGIFRGMGFGIGVTIVTAIIIYLLQRLVRLNLPGISKFIYDIEKIERMNR